MSDTFTAQLNVNTCQVRRTVLANVFASKLRVIADYEVTADDMTQCESNDGHTVCEVQLSKHCTAGMLDVVADAVAEELDIDGVWVYVAP